MKILYLVFLLISILAFILSLLFGLSGYKTIEIPVNGIVIFIVISGTTTSILLSFPIGVILKYVANKYGYLSRAHFVFFYGLGFWIQALLLLIDSRIL